MTFLQRLQDTQEENEELRHQLHHMQQLRGVEGDIGSRRVAGEQVLLSEIQDLKRQQHDLNGKLDVERLRYQNAVEQLKHAEAQAKTKSAEVVTLQEQLVNLERLSAQRLEEAVETLADLDAKMAVSYRAVAPEGDAALREALGRIRDMENVVESLKIKEEEGKRRERLMEQRNVTLENRLRKGGAVALDEPVAVARYDMPLQITRQDQPQFARMQEMIVEYQQQQQQQHQREQQLQQQHQAQLHAANTALFAAQQQHQQECRSFQQQVFAAEDLARSSTFATAQAQGLLEQSRDRIRACEADIKRLEETVREQEQRVQKQQLERPTVFQTVSVQTAYSSPVVFDNHIIASQSPPSSRIADDVPRQVERVSALSSPTFLTSAAGCSNAAADQVAGFRKRAPVRRYHRPGTDGRRGRR